MSATYPPEYQQSPPQPPPEVRPPRKRRRVRKTLLIIGGTFTALIVLIVIIALATSSNTIKPTATPSTTPSTPTAQSYPSVASLLAAMAAHGATCSDVSIKTGSTIGGALNPFADCSGASAGDTAIVMFTDHASALAYANSMISVGQTANTPAAEVVGPNWTVNTSPAFAPKVVSAVGGQLITAPASPATSAPAATPTPSLNTEPVGGTFSVSGPNGPSGANTTYNVTLDKVDQHAALGPYETLTNGNDHVTGAEFTIAGKSGQTSDDVNSDAVAVGTDGQDYTFSADAITDGTNFNYGEFNVTAGQSVNGWVSFELPPGVSIASVQWAPGGGQAATWTVGS